jgi:tetratricopeptide (TPR) repeat protein
MHNGKSVKKDIRVIAIVFGFWSIVSSNVFAQTAADWYKAGNESYNSRDYKNAIIMYSEVIKQIGDGISETSTPSSAVPFTFVNTRVSSEGINSYYMRGRAYYRTEDYKAAIADYEKVVSLLPHVPSEHVLQYSPGVYCSIGDSYGALKEYTKAVLNWEKYLEMKSPQDKINYNVDKSYPADMWFCATLWKKMLATQGTADGAKYDRWITEICSENSVTRVEIERFYKNNM